MTEYFKKFTMDKDGVTVIDFGENEVFECKYSDEAKSLCNRLNDLDYEKYNLKKENEQLKSILHYLLNVIQNKCSKDYPKCKEIVRNCFENDFNNTENDGDAN